MKIYKYPDRKDWPAIVGRQTAGSPDGIKETVAAIMEDVRTGGDSKVLEYVEKLDGYATDAAGLRVSGRALSLAISSLHRFSHRTVRAQLCLAYW